MSTARCLILLVLLMASAGSAGAGEAFGYRGPDNNGVFPAEKLLKQWPKEGPRLLWKRDVGDGWCHPMVAGGLVYCSSGIPGQLYVFTLDGKLLRKLPYGPTDWKRYGGTRSVPLIRDGVAVVSTPSANLVGIDLASGEWSWRANAWKSFGSGKGKMGWGYPESPLLVDDLVVFNTCSRDDATPPVVALRHATGEKVWALDPGNDRKRYSAADVSGAGFRHNGRQLIVYPTWRYIVCMDAATGEKLWELKDTGEKTITPMYNEGLLLVGLSKEAAMLRLAPDGASYRMLWRRPAGSGFSHGVMFDNRVYLRGRAETPSELLVSRAVARGQAEADEEEATDEQADCAPTRRRRRSRGGTRGVLCLDAQTGRVLDCHPCADGHICAADGMVYVLSNEPTSKDLTVTLLQPTAEGVDLAGRFRLPMTGKDRKTVKELSDMRGICPLIAEGRLFIRFGPLWVYDLRAEPDAYGWRYDGTGRVPNADPPLRWWKQTNLAWRAALPAAGGGSPVCAQQKVYVSCANNALVCVDAGTGKVLWDLDAGGRPTNDTYMPTPVAREDRVFAAFPTGRVLACDDKGKVLWDQRVHPARGDRPVQSPLLSEDLLIVQGRQVRALDVDSGRMVWSRNVPADGAFRNLMKVRLDDTNVLVSSFGQILRASDGEVLADGLPVIEDATPLVHQQTVYFCGNRGRDGAVMAAFRLPEKARPGMTLERLWAGGDTAAVAFDGAPLVHDGLLYILTKRRELRVYDATKGRLIYAEPLLPVGGASACGEAGLMMAGGLIYAAGLDNRHRTVVLRPGRTFEKVWEYGVRNGAGLPAFLRTTQFVLGGNALFALRGQTPAKPVAPQITDIAPVDWDAPPAGAPVARFGDDRIPDAWAFAARFPKQTLETDHLAALGGAPDAVLVPGRIVRSGNHAVKVERLTDEHRWEYDRFTFGFNSIDLTSIFRRKMKANGYIYTIVRNDRPRYVRFKLLTPEGLGWNYKSRLDTNQWLAGEAFAPDQVLQLEPGFYPLMIHAAVGEVESWGKIWVGPRFQDVTDQTKQKLDAYERAKAGWPAYEARLSELFILE